MKIAILNESYLKEEHLARLRTLGEVEIHLGTSTQSEVIERLQGVTVAVADCFSAPLTAEVFSAVSDLRFIAINSIGFDGIDTAAARESNILIANIPGYCKQSVAEHTFAFIFALSRKLFAGDQAMRRRPFQVDPANQDEVDLCLGTDLAGKTLGVIGLGQIGTRVAEIGKAFGMRVIAYDRKEKNISGVTQLSIEEVLVQSDVISLHLALTAETEGILSRERLALMKSTALLINTARGKEVDEKALYEALQTGRLAGAGLDVVTDWSSQNPLLTLGNVIVTPHAAGFSKESIRLAADAIVDNIESFVKGTPKNIVN